MKKCKIAVAAAVISLGFTAPVFSAGNYGSAGCGLGSIVFGDKSGFVQVFAATTNETSFSQTFGITSGTSNCEKQPTGFAKTRMREFVAANMDSLAKDIAMGKGESLQTLVELIGIAEPQRAEAYARLQGGYAAIFSSEDRQAPEVVDAILARLQV